MITSSFHCLLNNGLIGDLLPLNFGIAGFREVFQEK
jgi:hypothetical protein